jgi:hypothetical protein
MMRSPIRSRSRSALTTGSYILLVLAISTATVDFANAQVSASCQPSWVPTFGAQPGVAALQTTNGQVAHLIVFDDGSGPALYVAGSFLSAGSSTARGLAKWDGTQWAEVGTGFSGTAVALAIFDDGTGPALFVGGSFTISGVAANNIAKWDGHNWTALGSGTDGIVSALEVFDDGGGPALYAGGFYATAGGVAASCIAKWNGSAWSPCGAGIFWPNSPLNNNIGSVGALAVYDDGTGEALYVGGRYTTAGGQPANGIARWNGSSWFSMGSGLNGTSSASSLAVFDDGGGPALYMGGSFTSVGGTPLSRIAKWNGSTWSPVGGGISNNVSALVVLNDGNGPALYVGGFFTTAGGAPGNGIARWDGSNWSAFGAGVSDTAPAFVTAMAEFDDGHGLALYVGGGFSSAGGVALSSIARWDGTTWSAFGHGFNGDVRATTVFDDGHGPALFVGGDFSIGSGIALNGIAKWNGSVSSQLGLGLGQNQYLPSVHALTTFDDGSGSALYAGGTFGQVGGVQAKYIAKWNGSSWEALGAGTTYDVHALAVFDDGGGPALYAGGHFGSAGGVTVWSIAKWNGSNWSSLGIGMTPNSNVWALTVFDDGSGSALYVGGSFTSAGNVGANHIAKWNGVSWSALGSGVDDEVRALAVYDDGSGPALYAGGLFASAGGASAQHIAKWNGSYWSALGNGVNGEVDALKAFDDGNGAALYAGGAFTIAGTVAANHMAKWNGTSWSAMGGGMNNAVLALTTFNDSSGPALFAGGSFISAANSGDSYLAKWGCSFVKTGTVYCSAGTTSHGCVPSISASGSASASASSGFTLSVTNVEGQRTGIFFYGIHGQLASPWSANSTSLLCVKSPLQRMSVLNSGGTPGQCDGVLSEDWNAYRAAHATALGQPFLRGETVWAQGWFRDPPGLKTTKLSNGLVFAIGP